MLADYILLASEHYELDIVPCSLLESCYGMEEGAKGQKTSSVNTQQIHQHYITYIPCASLSTEHPGQLAMVTDMGDAPI